MTGGIPTGNARVRIKGRKGSVVRFLILSVGLEIATCICTSACAVAAWWLLAVACCDSTLGRSCAMYLPATPQTYLQHVRIELALD